MLGERVAHYRILSKLGEGGMGEVYLADDPSLGRKVAIKVLPPRLVANEEARERFLREARSAAALDHPYICKIYQVAADGEREFIAMEYVEGETLADRLGRGPIPVAEALRYVTETAEALQKAHSRSIVHRDLKPANLMLTTDGHVKVMDFGLAKTVDLAEPEWAEDETLTLPLTQHGMVVGTPGYMSPEQIRGEAVDIRSDLFALGLVLYEMLSGEQPFRRPTSVETFTAVLNDEPQPLSTVAAGAPEQLSSIVERLLAKEAGRRFAAPGELLAALEVLAGQGPVAAARERFSIAVLPFANVSPDPENDYLADGLAEDLINELARIDRVKVVARTSAFQFRGKEVDVREIGARLGVGTVLEGSVRASGNRLRVTAQLVNVEDGYHLWSERYDRERTDIFDIQDEITAAIGERVRATLGEEAAVGTPAAEPAAGRSPEAHRALLQGRQQMLTLSPAGLESARGFFERALAIDPDYADAHAALSWLAIRMSHFGGKDDPKPLYEEARRRALRALEISDAAADAHGGLGFVYMYADWDWSRSERAFLTGIELAPGSALLRTHYAVLLSMIGRHEEAVAEAYRAQELDPLAGIVNGVMGMTLNGAGRFEEAVAELDRGIELEPTYWLAYHHRATAHFCLGAWAEAAADAEKAFSLVPSPAPMSLGIVALERAGRTEEAAGLLEVFEGMADSPLMRPFNWAMLRLLRGELDEGFAWLERTLDARDGLAPLVPELCLFRGTAVVADPRFAAARARLGMPPAAAT